MLVFNQDVFNTSTVHIGIVYFLGTWVIVLGWLIDEHLLLVFLA